MTLDETVLQKLDSWKPPSEGRHALAFVDAESGASVQLAVDKLDALSCQLWDVSVTRPARAVAATPSLGEWAGRVAGRITGLLEPLQVVEVDDHRGQALLRSNHPAAKQEDLFYYEVLLNRTGTAFVRRFRGSRQAVKRQQVGYILTREALAKLAKDLAE